MKSWSKLQKELYLIIDPTIDLQIHCVAYPMRSRYGNTALPRYWITLGKEIIFDIRNSLYWQMELLGIMIRMEYIKFILIRPMFPIFQT